jgi:hypothetical protein
MNYFEICTAPQHILKARLSVVGHECAEGVMIVRELAHRAGCVVS